MSDTKINFYWKARNFKDYEKSPDWFWVYWTTFILSIGLSYYYFEDKILAVLLTLIAIMNYLNLKFGQKIIEYRIDNEGVEVENGKKILFEQIKGFNIDDDEMVILLKISDYKPLVEIPYEENHNIEVIEKVLSKKIRKDEKLQIPFLKKLLYRFLGY